ncbi:MAG: ClpXP protease specificity-enhancing factor SspB [Pseudomonadota bacterium]
MTASGSIDYDGLAQEAMRGVIRKILKRTEREGLPGDHHFYVSFDTQADGVNLSKRLREQYPKDMTIVLQHRFWDLIVTDERFEVKLTFDGIPERLVVPYASIKVFFDPSVRYALHFDSGFADEMDGMDGTEEASGNRDDAGATPQPRGPTGIVPAGAGAHVAFLPRPGASNTRGASDNSDDARDDDEAETSTPASLPRIAIATDRDNVDDTASDATGDEQAAPEAAPSDETENASDADRDDAAQPAASDAGETDSDANADEDDAASSVVVSLDAFRKK